jgi:hypothetical protein
MKKLMSLLALCLLPGCAAVDAVLMTKFDSTEYQEITEIRFVAEKYAPQCEDAVASKNNANDMATRTRLFELYSAELPRNGDGVKAATALNEIAQGLAKKYNDGEKVSPLFCKLKFEGLQHSADTIRHVLANRPR